MSWRVHDNEQGWLKSTGAEARASGPVPHTRFPEVNDARAGGWWLAPAVVLGAVIWVCILAAVFGAAA